LLFLKGCFGTEPEPYQHELLPITQNGAGTMGCLVNGEVFTATPYRGRVRPPECRGSKGHAQWSLDFVNIIGSFTCNEQYLDIAIYAKNGTNFFKMDTFKLIKPNESHELSQYAVAKFINTFDCEYPDQDLIDGEIIITKLGLTERFIAGLFHFRSVNDDCDTVNVTDGRFDLKF